MPPRLPRDIASLSSPTCRRSSYRRVIATHTIDAVESATTPANLDAWDTVAIKRGCLSPYAVGISNLRDLVVQLHELAGLYVDIVGDDRYDISHIRSHATKATSVFAVVTALVGLHKNEGKAVFCAKLVGTLCKPGSSLPPQLATKLRDAAGPS